MGLPGFRGVRLRQVVHGVGRDLLNNAVTDSAAQLAYYVLFALFPFLFFLVALTAYLPLGQAQAELMGQVAHLMPPDAYRVIQDQLDSLLHRPKPHLLTLGLAVAIYSASRGTDAFRKALNLAYDVKESRPWYKTLALSIAITVVCAVLTLVSVTMIVLGGKAGFLLFTKLGLGTQFTLVWSWLRWPTTALVIMLVAALAYYYLPDVKQEFRYITPGSVTGTVLWMAGTWGFTQYVARFGHYNVTYGSIGGVILLVTWIYISGLVFLLGGEINAVIEHASPGGKDRGARAPGEAPAPALERPSAAPVGAAKQATVAKRSQGRLARLLHRRPHEGPPKGTLH